VGPFCGASDSVGFALATKRIYLKILQEMLGHSTISITLDTYSHVLPNIQKEAVKAMEDMIN
jgi:integrase